MGTIATAAGITMNTTPMPIAMRIATDKC